MTSTHIDQMALALARRWRSYLPHGGHTIALPLTSPAVLRVCKALVTGDGVVQAVREISTQAASFYSESSLIAASEALVLACRLERLSVPGVDALVAEALASHRLECASTQIASHLRDPLTGLDSAGHFLSKLWGSTRAGGNMTVLLVVRAPVSLEMHDMESMVLLSRSLAKCWDLTSAAVLPSGIGLGCVSNPAKLSRALNELLFIAPELEVSTHPAAKMPLDVFARWLAELAGVGSMGDLESSPPPTLLTPDLRK